MTSTGIIPTYQRFVNGVPVPSFSRRSFRPREKYLILLVFLTFGVVCFGAFFFLPEFRGGSNTVNSVYNVYKHMQKAGPELLIPAPPHGDDFSEIPGGGKLNRHGNFEHPDPHKVEDRAKLLAKIEEDEERDKMRNQKVLERPDIIEQGYLPSASSSQKSSASHKQYELVMEEIMTQHKNKIVTIPPAPSDHYPDVHGGEDSDPVTRERRDKVREVIVGHNHSSFYKVLSELHKEENYKEIVLQQPELRQKGLGLALEDALYIYECNKYILKS